MEEFRPTQVESPVAPVYISEILLDGYVEEDRVHLTADIDIEITADGAFDVPLHLNQAHIRSFEYDGTGRAAPILDSQRDDGLHWRLEGQGTHRLKLLFWVPLRTSPAGHQLLLTLPTLPEYLVTRIRLKIPGNQSVLPRPEFVALQQPTGSDGTAEAEIKGQRLEMTWAERRASADTLSSVRTVMTLRRDGDQLLLDGTQEFSVEQGPVSSVELRLPDGFEVQDISLRDQTSLDHQIVEDSRSVRVNLPEQMHQKFSLAWTLARAFPAEGGVVTIDGLEVANAGNSQGEILIEAVDGYSVLWDASRCRGLSRMNVRDESATGSALGGFKFESPQFELVLEITPVTPTTDVDVARYLHVSSDELLMTLDVSVLVLTGSVAELQILWPERDAEKWAVIDRRIQVTSDDEVLPADFDDERNVLTLARSVAGTLHGRLRFRREFPENESGIDLTLPQVIGTWAARPTLFIGEAIDVTAALPDDPPWQTPTEIASGAFEWLPAGFADVRRVRQLDLPENQTSLHLERTQHPRSVTAATSVTISSRDDSVLRVVEEFAYEVAWGSIESMLFEVPEEVAKLYPPETAGFEFPGASLQFFDPDGNLLESTSDGGRYTVSLRRPRSGSFRVRLEYALPLSQPSPGVHEEYQLPIVQPLDANVTRTVLQRSPTTQLDLVVLDPEWESTPGADVWYVTGDHDACRIELSATAREFAQRLEIDVCYLQTVFSESGSARTNGVYHLARPPGEFLISLPQGYSDVEFRWDDEPLAAARDNRDAQYVLALPATAQSAESGWLSVVYHSAAAADSGVLTQTVVDFPSFGPDVHINETIWEVVLPHQKLLSRIPVGMTREFTWQRKAVLWMRSPTEYAQSRRNEILKVAGEAMLPMSQTGNTYAFSTTGSVSQARIESMEQRLVVLLGAGLTLLLGFVFGRFPAVRNVYSVLVLAFLFALAAVWYLELMQLLVQPALIGLCLAILAVKFDTATRGGSVFRKGEVSSRESGSDAGEWVSSSPGAVSSAVARTALYPAADASSSGSHPHD